jgi:hypothetical protein
VSIEAGEKALTSPGEGASESEGLAD